MSQDHKISQEIENAKGKVLDNLLEMSQLLELSAENHYASKAYSNAIRILEGTSLTFSQFVVELQEGKVSGIGSQLAKFINEALLSTEPQDLLELRAKVPEILKQLIRLKGIGPKKALALYKALSPISLEDLLRQIELGQVAKIKGFGEKTANAIKEAVVYRLANDKLWRLDEAVILSSELTKADASLIPLGELRRSLPVVSKLEFGTTTPSPQDSALNKGTRLFLIKKLNLERLGLDLLYGTGPERFISELQEYAAQAGFKLSSMQLSKGSKVLECPTEESVFDNLGLPYVLPEHRDYSFNEALNLTKVRLVEEADLKGIVHTHSKYSDGECSIDQIASYAIDAGKQYLVISDHSQSAVYANGLSVERLKRQHEEIDLLNDKYKPFRILKGIESDILADGELDYPDNVLDTLEVVICSVHSRFSLDKEEMTKRVCRAIAHPKAMILGHSSGRLLLSRPGYALDYERIFEVAVQNKVALEINANPLRLDLDWTLVNRAKNLGLSFPICPDAHSLRDMQYHKWGLLMARKAGLQKAQVLNTLSLKDFEKHCASK